MKKWPVRLIALLLLFLSATALANGMPEASDDFYYLDSAGVLSEDTKRAIFQANQHLLELSGAQIAVVALEDIGGADIEKYAVGMADLWGVGDPEQNNGFLLLMTIANEDYYATVGNGLSAAFPQDVLVELLEEYMEPDFAAGDYDAAAWKFFDAVYARVVQYYEGGETRDLPVPAEADDLAQRWQLPWIVGLLFEIAAVVIFLILFRLISLAVFHGGFGSGTHAGVHYRRNPDDLDRWKKPTFFEPRRPPDVYYGLGPDPYNPKPRRKK